MILLQRLQSRPLKCWAVSCCVLDFLWFLNYLNMVSDGQGEIRSRIISSSTLRNFRDPASILLAAARNVPPAFSFTYTLRRKKRYRSLYLFWSGGWGEIRTHGPLAKATVFKTVALDHSATHPLVNVVYIYTFFCFFQ